MFVTGGGSFEMVDILAVAPATVVRRRFNWGQFALTLENKKWS